MYSDILAGFPLFLSLSTLSLAMKSDLKPVSEGAGVHLWKNSLSLSLGAKFLRGYRGFLDTVADDLSVVSVIGHFFTQFFLPADGSARFWSDLRATHRMASALRMNTDIR